MVEKYRVTEKEHRMEKFNFHNESYLREQADQFYPVHIVLARRKGDKPFMNCKWKVGFGSCLKKSIELIVEHDKF
jgi:hypothetical protein